MRRSWRAFSAREADVLRGCTFRWPWSSSPAIIWRMSIFRVQVRAEEQHVVHNPDEQQHHDHTTNQAVGGVVLAEVVSVEGESETAQAHAERGQRRTGESFHCLKRRTFGGCAYSRVMSPIAMNRMRTQRLLEPDELDELHVHGFGYIPTDHVQDGYTQQHPHEHHRVPRG